MVEPLASRPRRQAAAFWTRVRWPCRDDWRQHVQSAADRSGVGGVAAFGGARRSVWRGVVAGADGEASGLAIHAASAWSAVEISAHTIANLRLPTPLFPGYENNLPCFVLFFPMRFSLCNGLIFGGNPKKAATPKTAAAYAQRAGDNFEKGDFDKAIADSHEAIRLDPRCVTAYTCRGVAYEKKKMITQAISDLDNAIRILILDLNRHTYSERTLTYSKKDFEHAIADATRAIQLDPKDEMAYEARGIVPFEKGDYDLAIADLTQTIEIDPTYASAYANRSGSISEKRIRMTRRWLTPRRPFVSTHSATGPMPTGVSSGKKGQYDKAMADATEAIRINPQCADAYADRRAVFWGKASGSVRSTTPPKPFGLNHDL